MSKVKELDEMGGSMMNLKAMYGDYSNEISQGTNTGSQDITTAVVVGVDDEIEDSFGQQSIFPSSRKRQPSSSAKSASLNVSALSQQTQQQSVREKRASIRKSVIAGHTSLERPANRNDIMALDELLDDKLKSKVNKGSIRANLEFLHKV